MSKFVALPAGWVNVYKGDDGEEYIEPCPGVLKAFNGDFEPACFDAGALTSAIVSNYVGTYYRGETK